MPRFRHKSVVKMTVLFLLLLKFKQILVQLFEQLNIHLPVWSGVNMLVSLVGCVSDYLDASHKKLMEPHDMKAKNVAIIATYGGL